MKQIDELIYDAIRADEGLMTAIGGRVVSTCFEVSPDEQDNTPVPYVIVTDDGFQNQATTKDYVWEGEEDRVQASVEIAADSPAEVKQLVKRVRRAVEQYIEQLYTADEEIPTLSSLSSQGIAWDWLKPCYYQTLSYQATETTNDDEQEE